MHLSFLHRWSRRSTQRDREPGRATFDNGDGVLDQQALNTDIVDTSFANEGLIEEPVTSGAEVSTWDCDDPDDPRCRRQPRSE